MEREFYDYKMPPRCSIHDHISKFKKKKKKVRWITTNGRHINREFEDDIFVWFPTWFIVLLENDSRPNDTIKTFDNYANQLVHQVDMKSDSHVPIIFKDSIIHEYANHFTWIYLSFPLDEQDGSHHYQRFLCYRCELELFSS